MRMNDESIKICIYEAYYIFIDVSCRFCRFNQRSAREITSIVATIITIITLIRFFRKMLSPEKLQTLVHAVNEFGGIMK